MLTDQAYCDYARSAEDEHRREHRRIPIAFGPDIPEEETSGDGQGQYPGKIRLGGAGASCEGGHQTAGTAGGYASKRRPGSSLQSVG